MSIQNQKNVQKNRKILKNLLMYDKKKFFLPHRTTRTTQKKHPPSTKKVRKEKKAEIPEKKLERNSPEKKNKP